MTVASTQRPRLVLASASAARRQMLDAAGVAAAALPAALDEAVAKTRLRGQGAGPAETALALAAAKAQAVLARPEAGQGALVIAADQILVCGDLWLDKPAGPDAARHQLMALRGRSHVLTSAVVLRGAGLPDWQAVDQAELRMRNFSEAWLDSYLAAEGEAVSGSVGGYRVEGAGVQLFESMRGDWFTILGLPLLPLLERLRELRVLPA